MLIECIHSDGLDNLMLQICSYSTTNTDWLALFFKHCSYYDARTKWQYFL